MGKQKHYRYNYHEREKEKHKSPEMEKQKRMVMHIESSERVLTSLSRRFLQSPSSTKVQIQNDGYHVNDVGPFVKNAQIDVKNHHQMQTRMADLLVQLVWLVQCYRDLLIHWIPTWRWVYLS